MIQGTMSNSGKSFLTAGLCRVFKQDGYKVAPFKSQNMALNSYITKDGLEIGRAQAMQAEACGIDPTVEMNPILLKPTSNVGSQVIVNGEVRGNMKAMDYYRNKKQLVPDVMAAYERLSEQYDIIVIEGAGSPAEINLHDNDIVNMGMARMAKAPVLLLGDIDRGGVFAALYGTVKLLPEDEQQIIKGLIVNKFRGDVKILEPELIHDFSYAFRRQDRIGFVGANGCGKTTMMKMIMGIEEPDEGQVILGPTVKLGYFSQENESLDPSQRVIDYIRDTAEYVKTEDGMVSASVMLERFLFDATLQYSLIGKLSGGEKRRLYLLKVLMEAPNILILDEPTNDLDIQTLAILEDYLEKFPGILITVSHDRYFLDKVVDRIFAFETGGFLRQYEGGYSDYLEAKKQWEQPEIAVKPKKDASEKTEKIKQKKLKFTWQEQKDYETIEDVIAGIEEHIADLDRQINLSATDFVKLGALTQEKEEQEALLDEKMERYLYLTDLAEQIEAQKNVK